MGLEEKYYVPEGVHIKFDDYGRPYEQTPQGRIMLSMKSKPIYSNSN